MSPGADDPPGVASASTPPGVPAGNGAPNPPGVGETAGLSVPPDLAQTPAPALSSEQLASVAPEVMTNSLGEYFRAWGVRIRGGESGVLPVIAGLVAIVIFFQLERSEFLHAANLVNLMVQASVFIMFGAAETFVLLLSEIDLSLGFGAGVGAFLIAEFIAPPVSMPWWLGVCAGLTVMVGIGALQGSLVSRVGLPSFVVTLGGQLALAGLMLEIANADSTAVGGVISISSNSPVYKLVNSRMSPTLGWIVMGVSVLLYAVFALHRYRRREAEELAGPPLGVTLLGIAAIAVGGIVLMLVANTNQGLGTISIQGMPWVIPFIVVVLVLYNLLLERTQTGRYVFAVGNSPEAARRAGVNVKWIITFGFIMASFTAGLAGLIYASNQGSVSTDINGGQLVLFAVAAAVIGGTSLFGGRGKIINAFLGGVVIAVVYNGLGLMGVSAAVQDIVTAVVLIAAVTMDALVRRRAVLR